MAVRAVACTAFFLVLMLSALPGDSSALSFGTLMKQESAVVQPGEVAVFRLLMWSTDKDVFTVSFEADKPEGWAVMFSPKQAVLPVSRGEEYMNVQSVGSVPAAVEKILVAAPHDASPGNYTIRARVLAGDSNFPISVLQGRSFDLNVQIAGNTDVGSAGSPSTQTAGNPDIQAAGKQKMQEANESQDAASTVQVPFLNLLLPSSGGGVPLVFVLLLAMAIIAASYIIYKI